MEENGNNIEFYKRQITDIVNRINDTDVLNYIHIIVSDIGKEVGVNEFRGTSKSIYTYL